MGLGNERILRMLSQHVGSMAFPHLEKAYQYSERQLNKIADVIQATPENERLQEWNCGYAAIGSLGRMEATSESDADLILLCTSNAVASNPEVQKSDQRVRAAIHEALKIKVSKGSELTSPTSIESVAHVSAIGGDADNVRFLTKRILLLTESRPVTNQERIETTRRGIFNAYADWTKTKGKHLHSLSNDFGRYYRTVCVDYKSRVDLEDKPFGIRNVKLRHRSKYLFFSTMMAMVGSAISNGHPEDVYEQFALTPTERLVNALLRAGLLGPGHVQTIAHFDHFVGKLADPEVRNQLETVKHETRKLDAAFMDLHENSKQLNDAMIATIYELPQEWRHHLFSNFLL